MLRPDLEPIPDRIRRLPVDPDRGYPVPWFVSWIDGKPEFRVASLEKLCRAIEERLCWVCGNTLGSKLAFVIGPMCAVNRISAEPPSHRECAEFSVRACPFLSKPNMERRQNAFPEGTTVAGEMIDRNPGVMLLWMTNGYGLVRSDNGVLLRLNNPAEIVPYKEGRVASVDEVRAGFDSGLKFLVGMCNGDAGQLVELESSIKAARFLLRI